MANIKISPYWVAANQNINFQDSVLAISKKDYEANYAILIQYFLANEPKLLTVLQDRLDNNAPLASLVNGTFRTSQPFLSNEIQPHIIAYYKYQNANVLKMAWNWLKANPNGVLARGLENYAMFSFVNYLMAEKLNDADKKRLQNILSQTENDEPKKRLYYGLYAQELLGVASGKWQGSFDSKMFSVYDELRAIYSLLPLTKKWN